MKDNYYELPKYKKEKIYLPYRCPDCYKILRLKIFHGEDMIKYNCQCKKEWYISFNVETCYKKPKKLDSFFKLRCSNCGILPNKDNKFLKKCSICNKIFCLKKSCEHNHYNNKLYNLNILDVTCIKHSKDFIAYCKTCDKDLCEICVKEEKDHSILYYKDILPKKEEFMNKYNIINKFSENFASSFKGVKRICNYELIYFFHFREIIRTIFFNLSRFSRYNKFNFSLISNFLENSDFTVLDDFNPKKDIIKYKNSPTSFMKSSKYYFDFLENKNNVKFNFFKEKKIQHLYKVFFFYVSSPNKKYFLIGETNLEKYENFQIYEKKIKTSIYNSKTFLPIFRKDDSLVVKDKYAFEDNRLICIFSNDPKTLNIFNINNDNDVKIEKFDFNETFTNIQLLKDSFLIQNKNIVKIFQDKGTNMVLDTIKIEPTNKSLGKLFGYGEDFIYETIDNNGYNYVFLYKRKEKHKICLMKKYGKFSSITRIDENNLLIEYNPNAFYLYDLENLQIVNSYEFDPKLNEIYITDNYFIIMVKNKKNKQIEFKIQNIFNSKFENIYNNIIFFEKDFSIEFTYKMANKLIILPNDLLCYYGSGLIYLYNKI